MEYSATTCSVGSSGHVLVTNTTKKPLKHEHNKKWRADSVLHLPVYEYVRGIRSIGIYRVRTEVVR